MTAARARPPCPRRSARPAPPRTSPWCCREDTTARHRWRHRRHGDGSAPATRPPLRGWSWPWPRARTRSRRGELQVVVDLATLLGLAEDPGLLAGQPVPAPIARELAGECGSMRRIVTDPVTGHLLDFGRRVYLPDPLKDFVDGPRRDVPVPGLRAARYPVPARPRHRVPARPVRRREHPRAVQTRPRHQDHRRPADPRPPRRRIRDLAHPPRPDRHHPTPPLPPRHRATTRRRPLPLASNFRAGSVLVA